MTTGNIPEEILFIYSDKQVVTRNVEGVEEKEQVTPAFVSDANNPKTIATGISWAEGYRWGVKQSPHKKTLIKNEPRSGYRIFVLEYRGEGGRAYKTITPEGFFVDLREDVLISTMLRDGIKPNAVLPGKYLFAKVGSQMKLILDGSELHKKILNYMLTKK